MLDCKLTLQLRWLASQAAGRRAIVPLRQQASAFQTEQLMNTRICQMLGIDFPLVAFSHCRDVVASVSRAGGFGVLGATAFTPDQLDLELKWIDDHIDGKPYGVDVLIPENVPIKEETG